MYYLIPRQDPPANDKPQTGTDDSSNPPAESGGGGGGGGGMSPVGIVMLVLFLLLLFGGVGYIVYSQLRARRLGLPAPSWRSYIPFLNNSRSRSTRPSTGPLGWIKSKTTSTGGGFSLGGPTGYTGAAVRSERTRAQFNQVRQDDEEAWDSRGYREYDLEDDTEMQRGRGTQVTGGYDGVTTYGNSGLRPNDEEAPRGRSRSRDPPYPSAEPAAPAPTRQQRFSKPQPRSSMDSFTGVSVKGGRVSMDGERRSVFREAM